MQRIIPFGRGYAQSAEFSVDEGQTIRFWLVREDYTTTPGHHAYAELQIKSASGNDRWTTLYEMTGDKAYYDLIGVDESLTYRWVRKDATPSIAIDRSQDGDYSRQRRAPVNPRQPDFDHPTLPVVYKAQSEAAAAFLGVNFTYREDGLDNFGEILGTPPALDGAEDPAAAMVGAFIDTGSDTLTFMFAEDTDGAGATSVDWSDYEDGFIGIATECAGDAAMTAVEWQIGAEHIDTNELSVIIPGGATPWVYRALAEGNTFFVYLRKPGQAAPAINLGARTGRFILDENDLPSRLSAGPFDTDDERVALSIVEGNTVIPWIEHSDRVQLDRVTNSARSIEAPGEYQWERSCNASPGVWLNTGWRA